MCGHVKDLWVLVICLVSNAVLLTQLPGRGVTARESISGLLVLLVLIFWVWDSGPKGLLCTWEQSVVECSQHFCNQKPCNVFANPFVALLAVFECNPLCEVVILIPIVFSLP